MLNFSGSESSGSRNDERVLKSNDLYWLHAYLIDNDIQKTQYKYYDKKIINRGITRLKQYIVDGYSNVAKCKSYPSVVFAQIRELLNDTKVKKSEKERREEMFNKILFNEDTSCAIVISNSNDDMIYLIDYDTLKDKDMYRRAIIESKNEKWHREQIQRFYRMGTTRTYKGSGSGIQST